MKLGKLNAVIDAAPKVRARTKYGLCNFEKGDLKRMLREHFKDRNRETGLTLDGDGCLAADSSIAPATR